MGYSDRERSPSSLTRHRSETLHRPAKECCISITLITCISNSVLCELAFHFHYSCSKYICLNTILKDLKSFWKNDMQNDQTSLIIIYSYLHLKKINYLNSRVSWHRKLSSILLYKIKCQCFRCLSHNHEKQHYQNKIHVYYYKNNGKIKCKEIILGKIIFL